MNGCRTSNQLDILSNRVLSFLLWWLPATAIVATGYVQISQSLRAAVWATALAIMGIGCFANAVRCRRIHCCVTGPFFLVMAVISVLHGLNVITLGRDDWQFIGLITLIGAVVLSCLPELLFGKY